MAQEYEYNIIPPPIELRDGWQPTAIEEKSKALYGCKKSFEIGVRDNKDLLKQKQRNNQSYPI